MPALRRDPLADPAPLIRRVYAYVAYRIGDGPDAEDVTSEVFERAVRYRASYSSAKGDPASWLVGIARRCIADLYAGRQPQPQLEDVAGDVDVEGETVTRLTLAGAVEGLDERDRELIALRFGADLTARQIGHVVGMRTNAVEVALHRALARLRAELSDSSAPASLVLRPVRI